MHYFPIISVNSHDQFSFSIVALIASHPVYEAEITIHVSNHVTLEGFIFFKMHFDNPCTGKEYPKDETKQTKIQANEI